MSQVTVHYFKHSHWTKSAFKNAEINYECVGDILYQDGSYTGFICFVPFSQNDIDLYAYENLKDVSLKRLRKRMEFSEQKYVSALNDPQIDQKFKLNRDPEPKTGFVRSLISPLSSNGIDLAKIPHPLENKLQIICMSRWVKFLLYLLFLIPLSVIAAYVVMVVLAIISYPFQIYIRKITREEWDFIFYGCLIVAPTLIIMSLQEQTARQESISDLNASLLRDDGVD